MTPQNKEIIITLSPDNENDDIKTTEDLLDFIMHELENHNIGAYLIIKSQVKKGE